MGETDFHLGDELAPDVSRTVDIYGAESRDHVIAPGLDGALSLVGSFVSRRYSLRNYFVFSEKRVEASACLIVKYDIRNDMAKVAEKTECSDVGFNIRF